MTSITFLVTHQGIQLFDAIKEHFNTPTETSRKAVEDIMAAIVAEQESQKDLQAYRDNANTEDGRIEVDENAIVSVSDDDGAYVQAWLWVDDAQ